MKNIHIKYLNAKGQRKTAMLWKGNAELGGWLAGLDWSKVIEVKIADAVVPVLPTQAEAEAIGLKDKGGK